MGTGRVCTSVCRNSVEVPFPKGASLARVPLCLACVLVVVGSAGLICGLRALLWFCGPYLWFCGPYLTTTGIATDHNGNHNWFRMDHNGNRDVPQRGPQLIPNGPQRSEQRTTTDPTVNRNGLSEMHKMTTKPQSVLQAMVPNHNTGVVGQRNALAPSPCSC